MLVYQLLEFFFNYFSASVPQRSAQDTRIAQFKNDWIREFRW